MKTKIASIVSTATLVLILYSYVPLVSAASFYSYCGVVTYGTDLVDNAANGILSFTVDELGNETVLIFQKIDTGVQQYMEILIQGDTVLIDYKDCSIITKSILEYSPGTYLISYTGEANSVTINSIQVPEFPLFLTLPLLMMATLLAVLVCRKKRTLGSASSR